MKILITGSSGYVGSSLAPFLLEKGYQIRIFDKEYFEGLPENIEFIGGNIKKPPENLMDDISAVIHLAAVSSEPIAQCDPQEADLVNHIGTQKIAKLAKEKGIKKFIFASSCSVYFTWDTPLEPPFYNEDTELNPISAYSLSKRAAEQSILDLKDDNFQPVIFRKGTIYGWSPNMRTDTVVHHFIEDTKKKNRISVQCEGRIWRPLVDIKDVIWAYWQALELPIEGIFNLCNENWNILELAKEVISIIPQKPEIDIQPYGTARNYKADNSKFIKTFNWKPQRTFEGAIKELWEKM